VCSGELHSWHQREMERVSFTSATFSISVFNASCPYLLRWIVGRSDNGLTVNESTVSLKRLNFYYEADSLFLDVCQALDQCRRVKKAGQQWKVPRGFRAPSLDALSWRLDQATKRPHTLGESLSTNPYSWFWLDRKYFLPNQMQRIHTVKASVHWTFHPQSQPLAVRKCI